MITGFRRRHLISERILFDLDHYDQDTKRNQQKRTEDCTGYSGRIEHSVPGQLREEEAEKDINQCREKECPKYDGERRECFLHRAGTRVWLTECRQPVRKMVAGIGFEPMTFGL